MIIEKRGEGNKEGVFNKNEEKYENYKIFNKKDLDLILSKGMIFQHTLILNIAFDDYK